VCLDNHLDHYDARIVRPLTILSCSQKLEKLGLPLRPTHMPTKRQKSTIIHGFQSITAIEHLAKLRGVKLAVTCDESVLALQI